MIPHSSSLKEKSGLRGNSHFFPKAEAVDKFFSPLPQVFWGPAVGKMVQGCGKAAENEGVLSKRPPRVCSISTLMEGFPMRMSSSSENTRSLNYQSRGKKCTFGLLNGSSEWKIPGHTVEHLCSLLPGWSAGRNNSRGICFKKNYTQEECMAKGKSRWVPVTAMDPTFFTDIFLGSSLVAASSAALQHQQFNSFLETFNDDLLSQKGS